MGVVAVVSFRLGLHDGVSVVAEAWRRSLHDLGWATYRVAAEGPIDDPVRGTIEEVVPGLAIEATTSGALAGLSERDATESLIEPLTLALSRADLVLVENLLSIPLNLPASRALARVLKGRPAVLHHHDPPWQRKRFAHITELPPDDPAWRHVTINRLTENEFHQRGLDAVTIYNGFDTAAPAGRRDLTRRALGLDDSAEVNQTLVAHPVRAIPRKNVGGAISLTEELGGIYWLPGPAEEGYGPELDRLLSQARCPVLRTPLGPFPAGVASATTAPMTIADLYAASDVVAFPSSWEGFGNPPIEAAIHRRPAVVGSYPVADELRDLGLAWYGLQDAERLAQALRHPDQNGLSPDGADTLNEALDHNHQIVERELSLDRMTDRIADLLSQFELPIGGSRR